MRRDVFTTSSGPSAETTGVCVCFFVCWFVFLFSFLSPDDLAGVMAVEDGVSLRRVALNATQGTPWASLENSSSDVAAPSRLAHWLWGP